LRRLVSTSHTAAVATTAAATAAAGTTPAARHDARFATRHIGPSAREVERMLAVVGAASVDELVDQACPPAQVPRPPTALPQLGTPENGMSETEALGSLRAIMQRNTAHKRLNFIGGGYRYDFFFFLSSSSQKSEKKKSKNAQKRKNKTKNAPPDIDC
jgi:hypothetical protein